MNVAIENQLETTDSSHLGQLLIYAAGSCARIAIWVATEFSLRARRGLHRLNEWTRDEIDFYGVQVSGSRRRFVTRPVPQFRVVVVPRLLEQGHHTAAKAKDVPRRTLRSSRTSLSL